MKASHLLIASFIITSSWALTISQLRFFARFNSTLVPLSGDVAKVPRVVVDRFSVFSYGPSAPEPNDFFLEDNYAFTNDSSTPGYVGFFHNIFSYGSLIDKTKLSLDGNLKLLNTEFSSCNGYPADKVRWIGHSPSKPPGHSCIEVEVYLLPYDKKTGCPVDQFSYLGICNGRRKDEV